VLCDPTLPLAFDDRPQPGAIKQADIDFASDVGREQALQVFEGHAGGQRLEGDIDIRPLVKPSGLHERSIDPHGGPGNMPGEGGADRSPCLVGECRIALATSISFFSQ